MPVYVKKSSLEQGLNSLAKVAAGALEGERENRRRLETDRDFFLREEGFDESVRQYDQTFAEKVREFDATFNEDVRQFDQKYDEGVRQFDEDVVLRREQMAVQRYDISNRRKTALDRLAAQQVTDASYLRRLDNLGDPETTDRVYETYTVSDGTGSSEVNIEELMGQLESRIGTDSEGVHIHIANWGGVERYGARAEGVENWDGIVQQAVQAYKMGDTAGAMKILGDGGIFQSGGVRNASGQSVGSMTGTDSEGSWQRDKISPQVNALKNNALEENVRQIAASTRFGSLDAFNRASKQEQDAAIDGIWGDFKKLPQLRKEQANQVLSLATAEARGAAAGKTGAVTEAQSSSLSFQTRYPAGEIDYVKTDGTPGLILDALPGGMNNPSHGAIQTYWNDMIQEATRANQLIYEVGASYDESGILTIDNSISNTIYAERLERIQQAGAAIDAQLAGQNVDEKTQEQWNGTGERMALFYSAWASGAQRVDYVVKDAPISYAQDTTAAAPGSATSTATAAVQEAQSGSKPRSSTQKVGVDVMKAPRSSPWSGEETFTDIEGRPLSYGDAGYGVVAPK